MPTYDVWIKLAGYVACIGIALELSHKLYCNLYKMVQDTDIPQTIKSVFTVLFAMLPLIATFVITAAFCTYVDNKSVASLGLERHPGYVTDVLSGMAIAFTCISIMFFIGCSLGWFQIHASSFSVDKNSVSGFCSNTTDLFVGSVFEELAIRGYVFFVLQEAFGGQYAVVGSALLFTIAHIIKHPHVPMLFALNALLFGLLAGQCRFATGMLWVPIGLHFGWNVAMGPIFGLPNGGRSYDDGLVVCTVEGPEAVTGGLHSPDAGLLGTLTLAIACIAVMGIVRLC